MKNFFQMNCPTFFLQKPLLEKSFIVRDWKFVVDSSLNTCSSNASKILVGNIEFEDLVKFMIFIIFTNIIILLQTPLLFPVHNAICSWNFDCCYVTNNVLAFTNDYKHVLLPFLFLILSWSFFHCPCHCKGF